MAEAAPRSRRFLIGLAAIAAVALAVRVGYVLGWHHPAEIGGDAFYYSRGADLFADGHGFPQPYRWFEGISTPAAQHPPAYIVVLALASVVGLDGYFAHQLLSCLLGTATVVVVGLLGRRLWGRRPGASAVGLIAAGLAAVYPNFWFNDAMVLSETLVQLTVALTLLAAVVLWERREATPRSSHAAAAVLGVAVAVAALTHAELVLLGPLIAVPLCLTARAATWKRRIALLGTAGGVCVLVLAPWCAYNLARFERPVLLTTGLEPALVVANCDETYQGTFRGWWNYQCFIRIPPPPGDESAQAPVYRAVAEDYIRSHRDELPGVTLARLGRQWGVYRPAQQIDFDTIEQRERPASRVAFGMYYGLLAAAVPGLIVLRRRRLPLSPLLAPVVTVTVSAVLIYGTTRFRAAAEVSLVLLAAVTLVAVAGLRSRRAGDRVAAGQPSETGGTVPP